MTYYFPAYNSATCRNGSEVSLGSVTSECCGLCYVASASPDYNKREILITDLRNALDTAEVTKIHLPI